MKIFSTSFWDVLFKVFNSEVDVLEKKRKASEDKEAGILIVLTAGGFVFGNIKCHTI